MARDLPPRARFDFRRRYAGWAILPILTVGALTACTPGTAVPSPSPSAPAGESTSSPEAEQTMPTEPATPSERALVPDGTAEDNLPRFTSVTEAVWATDARVTGRAYVDALTAAGFDKAMMQVTEDTSTVGNPAESIQFSVRWGDQCLIGQVGPATGEPVTVVVPVLTEGTCLVGQTRPIDW